MKPSGIPYLDFAWNPGGFGCTKRCPTCWAERQTHGQAAPQCPQCKRFEVHFHPERLGLLGKIKEAAVVGVQFVGDLFDPARSRKEIFSVLDACDRAFWQTHVFLTQRYEIAFMLLREWSASRNMQLAKATWWIGTTCHNQDELNHAADLFGNDQPAGERGQRTRWNWWVSAEPLRGPIMINGRPRPSLVVLGADNQASEPYNIAWHRQSAEAFTRAGVLVYMKQLWLPGHEFPQNRLVKELSEFPADLRVRQLPWRLVTKENP